MNKTFRSIPTSLRNAGVTLGSLVPMLAMAQTADPFTTAVATQTTNVETWGAALVVFCAVGVGFFVAIKYVKKIVRVA